MFWSVDITSLRISSASAGPAAQRLRRVFAGDLGLCFTGSGRQELEQPWHTRKTLTAALSENPHLKPTCQSLSLEASES